MKGDFTRDTFDPDSHFSRVLMQQGRVQLDADWNEQTAILLHYIQTLAADLIGPHAGPGNGFKIVLSDKSKTFTIGAGHYYVDGILCENEKDCTYSEQPNYPSTDETNLEKIFGTDDGQFLVYLDVWERHITHIDEPRIREVALGGPDTATRAKVIWQVKVMAAGKPEDHPQNKKLQAAKKNLLELESQEAKVKADQSMTKEEQKLKLTELAIKIAALKKDIAVLTKEITSPQALSSCDAPLLNLPISTGRLRAQVKPENINTGPCITPPDSKYRGAENQLYRVEIHQGSMDQFGNATPWTFKWSRDNGSVVAAWWGIENGGLVVSSTRGFTPGAWVEITSESDELHNKPGELIQLARIESDIIYLKSMPKVGWDENNPRKIRQWDGVRDGTMVPSIGADPWIDLEDGIQVCFEKGDLEKTYRFCLGDYWLIPARVATGEIEWPYQLDEKGNEIPKALAPRGIRHHYAPLAVLHWNGKDFSTEDEITNCRCAIKPLGNCAK